MTTLTWRRNKRFLEQEKKCKLSKNSHPANKPLRILSRPPRKCRRSLFSLWRLPSYIYTFIMDYHSPHWLILYINMLFKLVTLDFHWSETKELLWYYLSSSGWYVMGRTCLSVVGRQVGRKQCLPFRAKTGAGFIGWVETFTTVDWTAATRQKTSQTVWKEFTVKEKETC